MSQPKFPDVTAQLTGGSGNVFAIIGGVSRALTRAGLHAEAETFREQAMSQGSYDAVLSLAMETVNVR